MNPNTQLFLRYVLNKIDTLTLFKLIKSAPEKDRQSMVMTSKSSRQVKDRALIALLKSVKNQNYFIGYLKNEHPITYSFTDVHDIETLMTYIDENIDNARDLLDLFLSKDIKAINDIFAPAKMDKFSMRMDMHFNGSVNDEAKQVPASRQAKEATEQKTTTSTLSNENRKLTKRIKTLTADLNRAKQQHAKDITKLTNKLTKEKDKVVADLNKTIQALNDKKDAQLASLRDQVANQQDNCKAAQAAKEQLAVALAQLQAQQAAEESYRLQYFKKIALISKFQTVPLQLKMQFNVVNIASQASVSSIIERIKASKVTEVWLVTEDVPKYIQVAIQQQLKDVIIINESRIALLNTQVED